MRISVRQLRRVIKEAVEGEMGMPGNMPANEGGITEISSTYFKSDPSLLEQIAFKICPDLFVGYDPASGIVRLYMPDPSEADLNADLQAFTTIIKTFETV